MIITATGANSWINPELKNWPDPNDVNAIVADAVANYEAGAAILHVHLPRGNERLMIAYCKYRQTANSRSFSPSRHSRFSIAGRILPYIRL